MITFINRHISKFDPIILAGRFIGNTSLSIRLWVNNNVQLILLRPLLLVSLVLIYLRFSVLKIITTRALPDHFNLFLAHGARRIVVLSSTSLFTKHNSSDPAEQLVAQRLKEFEARLRKWAMANGIDWIILRPTLIYGLGRDKNITEIARFIQRFGFFPLFGPAKGLRQLIHAEDVAAACFNSLSSSNIANQAYNLTSGETLSYREMG